MGGVVAFLQRKMLVPSKAWKQGELGLLGQLQGLRVV